MQNSLEPIFVALADAARLEVVRLLREKPRRSSEVADALSLSRPLTSRHLGVLRKAGIVEETADEGDARVRVYRLRPQAFLDLRGWLDEVEAFWSEQLGAFQAHVEKKYGRASEATKSSSKPGKLDDTSRPARATRRGEPVATRREPARSRREPARPKGKARRARGHARTR